MSSSPTLSYIDSEIARGKNLEMESKMENAGFAVSRLFFYFSHSIIGILPLLSFMSVQSFLYNQIIISRDTMNFK